MRIGFDAKRAFFNRSGLGSYSRDTISILATHYPDHEYLLYTPSHRGEPLYVPMAHCNVREPDGPLAAKFPAVWRTFGLTAQLKRDKPDLYHGLSHEIPAGISRSGIKSVVTIHDLIFLRYPSFYPATDRLIYDYKFRYSCKNADLIIAISEQTKKDIIQFFHIPEKKIKVVYQGCNPRFYIPLSQEVKKAILTKYGLPSGYILCVATIEERKNQLVILEALQKGQFDIPVVFAGREKEYSRKLKKFISDHQLKNIFFTGQVPAEDLPGLYQNASLFVYPSVFEGFGIPILEALNSGVPVITSGESCFPEAGGEGSLYVDVDQPEALAEAIGKVLENESFSKDMVERGYRHAAKFREPVIARNLMNVYESLIGC